ncbi:hypothetical protein, partial [uncultured Parasutterella sp.]|uniref:hypothetical protein n=1 Tax=uncultured Parasutterella sp. TaxID=1263098 RepID=UPI002597D15A
YLPLQGASLPSVAFSGGSSFGDPTSRFPGDTRTEISSGFPNLSRGGKGNIRDLSIVFFTC